MVVEEVFYINTHETTWQDLRGSGYIMAIPLVDKYENDFMKAYAQQIINYKYLVDNSGFPPTCYVYVIENALKGKVGIFVSRDILEQV